MKPVDHDASQLFRTAWNNSTDDFERCIAGHYMARHQQNAVDILMWNQRSLDIETAHCFAFHSLHAKAYDRIVGVRGFNDIGAPAGAGRQNRKKHWNWPAL